MASSVRVADGQFDFAGGIDSGRVPIIRSDLIPTGLQRNQVAWLTNATVRGGAITQRFGWVKLCEIHAGGALYQGGHIYKPDSGDPHLICSVGGRIYQIRVDTDNSVLDLSAASGLTNPATETKGYFCQGEQFLVIQAGDYETLPLFWDGSSLRRSNGLVTTESGTTFEPAWTVPAKLSVVDVTLTDVYPYGTNQFILLGGYMYLHLLYTQRLKLKVTANPISGITPPVGSLLLAGRKLYPYTGSLVVDTTKDLQLLAAYTIGASGVDTTVYAIKSDGGSFVSGTKYAVGLEEDLSTWWTFEATADELAPPAVNHFWALNITDPRLGQAINLATAPVTSEIPAAGPMDYYMGRLWYSLGRKYSAGDIVRGTEGTGVYGYRDSILKVTENPLAIGGDGFSVPEDVGDIQALSHAGSLDTALGQSELFVMTRGSVHVLSVPVTRALWISTSEPQQRTFPGLQGTYSDRSVIPVNTDLFYSAPDGIRTIQLAIRDFNQWGNSPVSNNMDRVMQHNDSTLMYSACGIVFGNRLWQTVLPKQTASGVAFQGIVTLDFNPVSSLSERLPPVWDSMMEGLDFLQLFVGNFNGEDRAFAAVISRLTGAIELWELSDYLKFDNGDNRVIWAAELAALTWGKEIELKILEGGELWLDRVYGMVEVLIEYRVDADPCWRFWHQTRACAARSSCELVDGAVCYPEQMYQEGYAEPIVLPKPPTADCAAMSNRPTSIGYRFQVRITLKGWAQIRGIVLHATPFTQPAYSGLT